LKQLDTEGTISSIISGLKENTDHFAKTWFRGQPKYQDELLPSIFRQGDKFGVIYDEPKMFEEFSRRYPEQSLSHRNVFEWLTLMQHYGLPTRLLDWTSNVLVALYFCCAGNASEDGAIFALDPTYIERDLSDEKTLEIQVKAKDRSDFYKMLIYELGDLLDDDSILNGHRLGDIKSDLFLRAKFTGLSIGSSEPFVSLAIKQTLPNTKTIDGIPLEYVHTDIKRAFSNIVAFKSPLLNQRIRQQHGFFTFHGGTMFDGEEFIPIGKIENNEFLSSKILKIRIKASSKVAFLEELNYSGIREATLFPEMEYQARDIKSLFSRMLNQY